MARLRHALYLATALATGSVAMIPATASAQTADADRQIAYAIPPQDMSTALRQFAEASGLHLIYDAKITADKASPGVSGTVSARAALVKLLAGSGLSFQFRGDGGVILTASGDGGVRDLGVVNVEGSGGYTPFGGKASAVNGINGSRDVQATEGTGSYTSNALSVGTKSPQSIKDTPLAVSVLTQQRLLDQNINSLGDALNQMPGVSVTLSGTTNSLIGATNNQQLQFYSRGFEIRSFQIDGGAPLSTDNNSNYSPVIDLSQYDSIQIIRGAAGVFNGYGDPSGVVNLQRKKPLDHNQVLLEGQLASWDNYRGVVDLTGPIGLAGKLRGRLVFTYQDNGYYYRIAHDSKTLIYGIVDLDATPTTLLRAGFSLSDQNSVTAAYGLPRFTDGGSLNLPRSTCFCFPWNRGKVKTTEFFAEVDQKIAEGWSLVAKATYNRQRSDGKYGYGTATLYDFVSNSIPGVSRIDTTADNLGIHFDEYHTPTKQLALDGTVNGHFRLLGQDQEVQFGGNYSTHSSDGTKGYATYQPIGTANAYNFNPYAYPEPMSFGPSAIYNKLNGSNLGAYASLKFTPIERVHFTTSIRYNKFASNYDVTTICDRINMSKGCSVVGNISAIYDSFIYKLLGITARKTIQYSDHNLSKPNLSVSYDVTKQLAAYATYADIYVSQGTNLTRGAAAPAGSPTAFLPGDPIAPIRGYNLEAGMKWASPSGRLNANIALYSQVQKGFGIGDGDLTVPGGSGTSAGAISKGSSFSCCYIADSQSRQNSRGFDIDVTGQVMTGLQLAASYTFNENKKTFYYLSNNKLVVNPGFDGVPLITFAPKHLVKLWGTYQFQTDRWYRKMSFGFGVNFESDSFQSGTNCVIVAATGKCNQVPIPSYPGYTMDETQLYQYGIKPNAVLSTRVEYKLNDTATLSLNVNNITDNGTFQSTANLSSGNYYKEPRSATFAVRAKF